MESVQDIGQPFRLDSKGQRSSLIRVQVAGSEGEEEVGQVGVHFLRRTAVLILRPAMGAWPAGVAVKVLADLERVMTSSSTKAKGNPR